MGESEMAAEVESIAMLNGPSGLIVVGVWCVKCVVTLWSDDPTDDDD